MRISFYQTVVLLPLLFCNCLVMADDQTTEEFQAYVTRRMPKVDEEQLAAFIKLVDVDDDGHITDVEFAGRIDAYQQAFKSVTPTTAERGHGLPDNWLTDFESARELSIESGKPIVAMFSASWCGPCKAMIANVFPTDEAKKALEEFVPVYIDSEKQQELASENNINAYPTFICFDVNGAAIEQHRGGGDIKKLMNMLTKFKNAKEETKSE